MLTRLIVLCISSLALLSCSAPAAPLSLSQTARLAAQAPTAAASSLPIPRPSPTFRPATTAPTPLPSQLPHSTIRPTLPPPSPAPSAPPRVSLSFIDAEHGWLAMNDALFATDDSGQTWQLQQTFSGLQKVAFISESTGWVATRDTLFAITPGTPTWRALRPLMRRTKLAAVVAPQQVWLYTPDTFLVSKDAGQTFQPWESACGNTHAVPSGPFSFIDPNHGWQACPLLGIAGMRPNELYYTDDGGQSWAALITYQLDASKSGLPAGGFVSKLTFIDAQHGWLVASQRLYGDKIHLSSLLTTVDGGRTWAALPVGPAGTIQEITFVSTRRGYLIATVGDSYTLYTTDDGGQSWQPIKGTPPL